MKNKNEMEGNVQPDLAKERKQATLNVESLTNFIYGGKGKVKRKHEIEKLAIQDQYYKQFKEWSYCSAEEKLETSIAKRVHMQKVVQKHGLTDQTEINYYRSCVLSHESCGLDIQFGMFAPTITKQGTEEQKKKWVPLINSFKILGTYAQTEIGHGTFLRGLETTATYDPKTQEFVLNSPTITSIKFWPAGLGKTTNHCVVAAQLYTGGKCHGIHMFMLQIRSMEDHTVLPGIEVGVIGNKFGFETNDNGFLRMNHVRIPRENMMMRYSQVLKDGTYVQGGENPKLTYGVMVYVRALLVKQSFTCLSQACVIAIRYSAVRRQSEMTPGGVEPQVLDYQTQQYRLFPLLAASYAFHFASEYTLHTYADISGKIERGDMEDLPQLHALSAGLKAFTAWVSSAGVETCRLVCGGHGYSHASGLPKIYVAATPGCTYEGENNVLMLQVARYLMRCYNRVQEGKRLPGFVQYIGQKRTRRSNLTANVSLNDIPFWFCLCSSVA